MALTTLLLAGFALGFLGSVPVAGPIALLVFSLVIEGKSRRAVLVAAGAGLAEGTYAFLAFWGFSNLLSEHALLVPISRGLAAVILAGIGVALVRRRPASSPPLRRPWPGGGFLLGFAITALNPTLIGTWSAAVTSLFSTGLVTFSPAGSLPFALGAAAGIVGWFALVVVLGRMHAGRFRPETLDRVVRAMGYVAIVLAVGFAGWTVAYFVS
jgi:threonine/homoserine/homoserine lactone efflux protein